MPSLIVFATDFAVAPNRDRADFVAQLVAWLRGTKYSTVLDDAQVSDLDQETAYLVSPKGEQLRLREYKNSGYFSAIGFRHDVPDGEGRIWRTEAVLRRSINEDKPDVIRFRTQCSALQLGAKLETPKKPYIVKSVLQDGWGGRDGILTVSDRPMWLKANSADLDGAAKIILGDASEFLPVIYISAVDESRWFLSTRQIEKLAYDLGGIAHIAVEPNRTFSFQLRDKTGGSNVYGGTIGISLPKHGIARQYFRGGQLATQTDLVRAVSYSSINIRSQMPSQGWDWTELQEASLRLQRERDKNRLTNSENENLFLEEIDNLQERIKELESQLADRPFTDSTDSLDERLLSRELSESIGPEIYPGEFSDRLRLAAQYTSENGHQKGLSARSIHILDRIYNRASNSPALDDIFREISQATKEPKRSAENMTTLLSRHGYMKKSDKKHPRLESRKEFVGLEPITLSKTPSEHRAAKNLQSQIENALGLKELKKIKKKK